MNRERLDVAGRLLGLAAWLLPAGRRDWGLAMYAELLQVEGGPARRRFALGCVRAALLQPAMLRALVYSGGTLAAVSFVLAGGILQTGARIVMVTLVLVLAALAWQGGRPGLLGPVRRSRTAVLVRAGGYTAAGVYLLVTVMDGRGPQLLRPDLSIPLGMITLVLFIIVMLALTSRESAVSSATLASGICAGLVAGPACFLLVPFERVLPPLADSLPGHGLWLLMIVVGAPTVAMLVVAARTNSTKQALMAVLCGGAICAVVVSALGDGAWLLFPGRMPSIVPENAGSAAVRHALSRLEAGDEYVAGLVWGSLLAALLAATIRTAVRIWTIGLRTTAVIGAALAVLAAFTGDPSSAVMAALAAIVSGMLTLATAPRAETSPIPPGHGGHR